MSPRKCPALPAALASALLACGSSYEPGVHVELLSRPHAELTLSSAWGVVKIDELSWTGAELELVACASSLARLGDWLVPDARAHGTSTPTVLAVPTIVSARTSAALLGELVPPPGRYCGVRYRVAPADDDAIGLEDSPDMQGVSLRSRGQLQPARSERSNWSIESRRSFDVTREIQLELSREQPRARLSFGLSPERWREEVGAAWFEPLAREEALIQAFRSAFEIQIESD